MAYQDFGGRTVSGLLTQMAPGLRFRVPPAKRLLDIALVLLALPVIATVIALAALVILATGSRPFFWHERIGAGGRRFRCLKLTTMQSWDEARLHRHLTTRPDAGREWARNGKLQQDPRVGRLGAVLRRTSLDELPQALNVLAGQMSLVGPRPITARELAAYRGAERRAYLSVQPGLTGLWQVRGRNRLTLRQRARLDAEYVRRRSVLFDLAIMARTIPLVLRCTGV